MPGWGWGTTKLRKSHPGGQASGMPGHWVQLRVGVAERQNRGRAISLRPPEPQKGFRKSSPSTHRPQAFLYLCTRKSLTSRSCSDGRTKGIRFSLGTLLLEQGPGPRF